MDNIRKNKPVYFSKTNEMELKLLQHAEKINPLTGKPRNFSEYVRLLIENDMNGYSNKIVAPVIEHENLEQGNAMLSFL